VLATLETGLVSVIRTFALAVALAVGCALACNTPSIPIPPPERDAVVFEHDDADGTATFSYRADLDYSFAVVYVFNRTQGLGIIDTARGDGSVGPTARFPADIGDQIQITFELDDQLAGICVPMTEGTPLSVCDL